MTIDTLSIAVSPLGKSESRIPKPARRRTSHGGLCRSREVTMPPRRATRDQAPPHATTDTDDTDVTRDELIEALGNLLTRSAQLFADVQTAKGREAYSRAWSRWDALAVRINSLSEGVDILDGR